MKDTNKKTNRLSIAVLIFVTIIVIGLVTISRPDFEYQITTSEALEHLLSLEGEMVPEEMDEIMEAESEGYQFVDLRNPYDYQIGHVEGAINIPMQSCFDEKNIEFFDQMVEDSMIVILYGYDQLEANAPWMLLTQLGYSNLKILLGGYGYYSGETFDMFSESEIPQYLVEEPKYDFVAIIASYGSADIAAESMDQPIKVIPSRKRKKSVVEGGC